MTVRLLDLKEKQVLKFFIAISVMLIMSITKMKVIMLFGPNVSIKPQLCQPFQDVKLVWSILRVAKSVKSLIQFSLELVNLKIMMNFTDVGT